MTIEDRFLPTVPGVPMTGTLSANTIDDAVILSLWPDQATEIEERKQDAAGRRARRIVRTETRTARLYRSARYSQDCRLREQTRQERALQYAGLLALVFMCVFWIYPMLRDAVPHVPEAARELSAAWSHAHLHDGKGARSR